MHIKLSGTSECSKISHNLAAKQEGADWIKGDTKASIYWNQTLLVKTKLSFKVRELDDNSCLRFLMPSQFPK
jgi:hypothetical protein